MDTREKDDRFLEGRLEDTIRLASERYMITESGFLDSHERGVAEKILKKGVPEELRTFFYGGYEDAERTALVCVPEYLDFEEENPFTVVRALIKPGGRLMRHGDYLGSLLGLGIDREKTGDILVRENGADIIIEKDILEFVMMNYTKVGRTNLNLENISLDELIVPKPEIDKRRDTVMSMRLDSIVAAGFRMSRSEAQEVIRQGRVSVDHIEETGQAIEIKEGSSIVCRGKGKMVVTATGGKSRKGRTVIDYDRYL